MKRVWVFILVIGCAGIVSAQESSVIVDLHGGTSKIMHGSSPFGAMGGLGLRYQCLFPAAQPLKLGIATGIGVDYAQVCYRTTIDRTFTLWDQATPRHQIDYSMTGGYEESFQQLRIQVPVLLVLRVYGVTFNVGVGVSGWKMLGYKEQWAEPHLKAYYPDFDVTIEDADPAGLLTEQDFRRSIGMRDLEWSVNVIGEVGYEWKVRLNDGVGLQAFVQYGVWSTRVPIMDLGLKVYYRFGFKTSKRHRGDCHCL